MKKGLLIAREYFEMVGLPAIRDACPEAVPRMAAGLAGEGSDCFGFDDEVSRDHDWGPAFCIWLTEEDYAKYGEKLRQIYENLPRSYDGIAARNVTPEAAHRTGVMTVGSFYQRFTGMPGGPDTLMEWFRLPEDYLAVAVNGEVFCDPVGEFTAVREKISGYYPEDVRRKKIAARAAKMAQSGQYNYARALAHGEPVAAQLALDEFIRTGISMVYLLNRKYMPFYKWAHRGMRNLELCGRTRDLFEKLCAGGAEENSVRQDLIERISAIVLGELIRQGLCRDGSDFLLDHCGEIMEGIRDPQIRSMHVMAG